MKPSGIFYGFFFKKAKGSKETLIEYLDSTPFHMSNYHSFPANKHLKRCPHPPNYTPEDKSYQNVDDKGLRKLRYELENLVLKEHQ